jgi:hypothetical protein
MLINPWSQCVMEKPVHLLDLVTKSNVQMLKVTLVHLGSETRRVLKGY